MMIQRPFSSGSRQAPDPHDIFLEEHGFYRKHTARDSSCLFRAISEQMYHTQSHHLTLRETCVNYMRKNKTYFQNCIKQYTYDIYDFDEYLDELSKPKTYATLLELEAMGHMFARNIILFRPLELGYWFFYRPNVDQNFQIFLSHDRHFDTVYESNYIEDAAFCQSFVYELLYKHVFKLPDITYAVERMLHASSFEEVYSSSDGIYCREIFLKDGRVFQLDTPDTTSCILNNYELCHFHNDNFPEMADILQNEINRYDSCYDSKLIDNQVFWGCENEQSCSTSSTSYFYSNNQENTINENDFYVYNNTRMRQLEALLPEKYVSCVRQLLYEGITPFPYKVAKALDPDMYRNIEFDSWSEMRKEQRWKNWYTGGSNLQIMSVYKKNKYCTEVCSRDKYRLLLQVGVKCQVYVRKYDEYYTGYIQEMSDNPNGPCVVFIEDLGEKKTVTYDCLKPLPPDQAKPWPLPYRWQRQYEKFQQQQQQQQQIYTPSKFFKRFSNNRNNCKMIEFEAYDIMHSFSQQHYCEKDDIDYKLKQYCDLGNYSPSEIAPPIEIVALPLAVELDGTPLSSQSNQKGGQPQQTPSSNTEHASNKSDEIPIVPSSSNPQLQQETEIIESNYVDENIPVEQNTSITTNDLHDGSVCQYPVYNYYSEPYYYPPYDNSIIHAATGGQYYCVVPNSTSHIMHHTGQPGPINSQMNNMSYYPPPVNQSYYSTSAVLQPIITQPMSAGHHIGNIINNSNITGNNTNNVNFSAQKSVLESGVDLPTDVETLRFFFNLGLDYYNNKITNEKEKDNENDNDEDEDQDNKSRLSDEFVKLKIENENVKNEKCDTNNNVVTNNHSGDENIKADQHYLNKNQQSNKNYSFQSNNNAKNNNMRYNNNNPSYNNNTNTCHGNNNNRGGYMKHFSARYFNNKKTGNYSGGNAGSSSRVTNHGHGKNNAGIQANNFRNENRNLNSNANLKTGGNQKNEAYQKVNNKNNNSKCASEPDSSHVPEYNNKDVLEHENHHSPISTTSENNDMNQNAYTQQQTTQPISSASSYNATSYADNSHLGGNEQQFTNLHHFNNGSNTNANIYIPQVITPVPFGMYQNVAPTSGPQYSAMQTPGAPHNASYQFISPGPAATINTSHPPPPLPAMTVPPPSQSNGVGVPLQTNYSVPTSHIQQPTYYYQVPPPHNGQPINVDTVNTSVNSGGNSGIGNGGDISVMNNFTPDPTGSYPFIPVYYTPTNNGGLTPTGTNSGGNHIQSNSASTSFHQGYWLTTAPVHQQLTLSTPTTTNNKINFNGSSHFSH